MNREAKLRHKATREGPYFNITLYDDLGRFVLRARVPELDAYWTEQISEYLRSGRLTGMALQATQTSKQWPS